MERQLKPIKTRSFGRTSPMIQNINQRQIRNGYQSQRDTHTHTMFLMGSSFIRFSNWVVTNLIYLISFSIFFYLIEIKPTYSTKSSLWLELWFFF